MKNISLHSETYWVKIVDFLQQNWALIEENAANDTVTIYFIQDASMIFDKIDFENIEEAEKALLNNGFKLYLDEEENFTQFIVPPKKPFGESPRPIYSSGQYWQNES